MPSSFARSSGRVAIDANYHEFYKEMTEGKNAEDAPFITMKDLFMLAACVGFRAGQSKPLGKREQPFHYSVFSESEDIPILKAIAIAYTNDVAVLEDADRIVEIAEEYANAGIGEVKTLIKDSVGQPLWALVEALHS